METLKFEEMGLSPQILKAVTDMGFEEATPIQSQAIPFILKGKDIIGQSQTGTGKTASFGIPCLEMIDPDSRKLESGFGSKLAISKKSIRGRSEKSKQGEHAYQCAVLSSSSLISITPGIIDLLLMSSSSILSVS